MTESDRDRIGERLDTLEATIASFKKEHDDKSTSFGPLHTGATGSYGKGEFSAYLFEVLRQQHNLLVLLSHRLDELAKQQ